LWTSRVLTGTKHTVSASFATQLSIKVIFMLWIEFRLVVLFYQLHNWMLIFVLSLFLARLICKGVVTKQLIYVKYYYVVPDTEHYTGKFTLCITEIILCGILYCCSISLHMYCKCLQTSILTAYSCWIA